MDTRPTPMPKFPAIQGPTPEQAAAIRDAMSNASRALTAFGDQLAKGYADFARDLHAKADAQGARYWVRIR